MITPSTIYFIGILDSVNTFFTIITIISSFALSIFLFFYFANELSIETDNKLKKIIFMLLGSAFICGLISVFTPSSKVAASMYIIPAIVNNENIQAIGNNSLEGLRKLSEQWLKELSNGKSKTKESDI